MLNSPNFVLIILIICIAVLLLILVVSISNAQKKERLNKKLQEDLTSAEGKLKLLEDEKNEVDEKLHLKENEYGELKDDLEKKNKENEELQEDLTTAEGKLKLLEDEKNEVDEKLHLKENEYEELKDDLEKKNKENEELQEDLTTTEGKLKLLEDEKNEIDGKLHLKENEYGELRDDLEKKNNENEKLLEDEKNEVDEKLHLKENEYEELKDDLEKKNKENEELQKDLTTAEGKLKLLEDEKNEIDGKFHLKENEYRKLKDDLEKKNKENEELQEDLATAEEKLKQLEDEKNEVDEKLHLKENEYRKLNDDLEKKNEENEELQEDLTSAKRKLKQLKDEKNEIDGKFHLKENECGKLKDDLGNKNKENEELSEEKKLQQKSIDFVNALLTATPMKKSSTDESIDNLVAFMKDEVKICLKNIDELENGYENNIDIWANLKKKTWIDNKTVISFVGEFSAGKTFIINKILEACDKNSFKLPEDPRPATAIPTYISKGDRDEFIPLFTSTDGVLKKITTDKFMNVDKELLSKIEASSLIQYFVLKYPNLNLQNLSILDTPGFDSGDEQDSERTLAVVNESHALFWVFEAGVGEVNQESLKIIKEHLKRPLYIVINNKNEDKSPKEIDDVETSVRKTLKNAGVNIKEVIRFSRNNINDLFKHIAGISIEKTMENDYLKKIKNKLEEKEKEFSKQLDNFNKEITEKENKLNEEINERERKFRNLKGALDDIKYAPKMENSFSLKLWKDKYAMSKEEYHIFNREIENSKNVLKNVKKDNKDIKGILDDLSKKTKEKEEIYKEFRKVKDCLERLGKISKDFI